MNSHFTSFGTKLASSLSNSDYSFVDYLKSVDCDFKLKSITAKCVFDLINKLDVAKATGLDGITSKLLKEAAPVISHSLSLIFNASITSGIFPDQWKYA